MNVKKVLLICLSSGFIFSASCASVSSDNFPPANSTVQLNNKNSPKTASAAVNKDEKNNDRTKAVGETSLEREQAKTRGKCQPADVPLGLGLPSGTNMSEVAPQPKSREEFDDWLASYGGLRLAEQKERTTLGQYYQEADFNNDGCQDVVVMVRGAEDKTGKVSLENTSVEVTVQNLRTDTIFEGGDESKLPFSPKFALQMKPQEPIALFVVFGGEKGWSWKHAGRNRNFLLYDSISQSKQNANSEESATIFGVIEKNKPENDDDDLLPQLPKNAIGDCIHTEIEISPKNANYLLASKRNLIGFEGKKFVLKRLSDTKLYKE